MDSFNFIESAVILNLNSESVYQVEAPLRYFSIHQDALRFFTDYVDTTNETPTTALLTSKYPTLDENAVGISLDYSLPILKKQFLTKEAVSLVQKEIDKIQEDPEKRINNMISKLDVLTNQFDDIDEVIIYDAGSLDRLERYRQRGIERNKLGIIGIPTPIRTVNSTGVGIEPGNLAAVYARPWVGKSWFCLKQAAVAIESGYSVFFVSPEMTRTEIDRRLDVILGNMQGYNFSHKALRTGEGLDEVAYAEFLQNNSSRQLLTCDHLKDGPITHSGLRTKLRKHRPDLFIIDAFHLINNDNSGKNWALWQTVADAIYGLKSLAVGTNISIMVTVQANRGAVDVNKPPKLGDVAFSDGILQASDYLFSMSRVKDDDFLRNVQLQKIRDSEPPASYVQFIWDPDIGLIKERPSQDINDYDDE